MFSPQELRWYGNKAFLLPSLVSDRCQLKPSPNIVIDEDGNCGRACCSLSVDCPLMQANCVVRDKINKQVVNHKITNTNIYN